ncbi:hypothetical protein GOODEAATRI_034309 [Goodea atripinnis]|uniref:Uncharacterized protein n=1 Tax=Goodea atripinnis TaxID=208336 RepID=A0ABV0PA21_9TELE
MLAEATPLKATGDASGETVMLMELRKLRQENTGSFRELKSSLHQGYLLEREAIITAKCDDMENRLRRNNIRLYGVPEGAEKEDMINFITDLLSTSLEF